MDDRSIEEFAKNSTSIAEVLRKLGRAQVGSNYKWLNKKIVDLNINTSHFKPYKNNSKESIKHEDIFCEQSEISRSTVRKRIIKKKLLSYNCSVCSLNEWNNKKISLVLDHINGIRNDNRIENLRWLCPNCNSQTDTFAGRNIKNLFTKNIKKCDCGVEILKTSIKCKNCELSNRERITKIVWPDPSYIKQRLVNTSVLSLSKELGVSDVSLHKFCRKHNIK